MMLALVLVYHLFLLVALTAIGGVYGFRDFLLAAGLLALGSAALIEMKIMLEPTPRRRTA